MKTFCVPADFRNGTLERYAAFNRERSDSRVAETYGNLTVGNPFGSGRDLKRLPPADMPALAAYVRRSRELGIGFSYTINASFMRNQEFTPEGMKRILAFLGDLRTAGVDTIVVALPSLIELARRARSGFRIKASAICQITSPNKARAFRRMGADALVLDESVNRDFEAIRAIRRAFGEGVEIIVNSICHQDCEYRMFHYNQISADSVDHLGPVSSLYYPARCLMRAGRDPAELLKLSWIRPEDLHHYVEAGIDTFKLQGRQTVLDGDPLRAVACYADERFDGELKDLLYLFSPRAALPLPVKNRSLDGFLDPFVRTPGFCRRDCSVCDYCGEFARRCEGLASAANPLKALSARLEAEDGFGALVQACSRCEGYLISTNLSRGAPQTEHLS